MIVGTRLVSFLESRTGLVAIVVLTLLAGSVATYLLWDVDWPRSPEDDPCRQAVWGVVGHPDRELRVVPGQNVLIGEAGGTTVVAAVIALDGVPGREVLTVVYSVDKGPTHLRSVTRGTELEGVLRFEGMVGRRYDECRPVGLGAGS
jgi:hypothetical protein